MEGFLKDKLDERINEGKLRQLRTGLSGVDFVSNDYLGLARNERLAASIEERYSAIDFLGNGGTGSRLLSGNHPLYTELEAYLKTLFQSEAVLVFNSGYAANQGLVSAVAHKGDTVLYDQLSHVCLKEGAWLSRATTHAFEHNDPEALERHLKLVKGRCFVVTETLFSMDGDFAPIGELLEVCERYGAHLIVDEAHSTGVYGRNGNGWLLEQGFADRIFARVYTFGKAMGLHGACVAGSQILIDYLINFGRTFIYTTSLPPHSILAVQVAFEFLAEHPELQENLKNKIIHFRTLIDTPSQTAIHPIMVSGNEQARTLMNHLLAKGFDARAILSPTVPPGAERIRVCLHVHNSLEEINQLVSQIYAHHS